MTLEDLKVICRELGLLVVGERAPSEAGGPGIVVRARTDNHKLRGLPEGSRCLPAGSAYTVIQIPGPGG